MPVVYSDPVTALAAMSMEEVGQLREISEQARKHVESELLHVADIK